MSKIYPPALLLLCSAQLFSAVQTWELTGRVIGASLPLRDHFIVGDTFTIRFDIDTAAIPASAMRYSPSGSSSANWSNVISNGSLQFHGAYAYSAAFDDSATNPMHRTLSIVNSRDTLPAGSGEDQVNITMGAANGSLSAPSVVTNADTFTALQLVLNFFSTDPGMLIGSGVAFPTPDTPFPLLGENFFPEKSTNPTSHFRLVFLEGDPEGSNMVLGTFTDFAVVPEPSYVATLLAFGAGAMICWQRRQRKRG